ncbi:MAG: transposase [Bacteroidetes bacterium]|nr:transposase [Bacteroidota bacterium]
MVEKALDLRNIFKSMDIEKFLNTFDTPEKCHSVLAVAKWTNGFICRKCGGVRYGKGKSEYSRRCTSCKTEESATAHTIFHHCRIELPLAFELAYRVCGSPEMPASELAQILDSRHMTCLKFKKKILECITTHGDFARNSKD